MGSGRRRGGRVRRGVGLKMLLLFFEDYFGVLLLLPTSEEIICASHDGVARCGY